MFPFSQVYVSLYPSLQTTDESRPSPSYPNVAAGVSFSSLYMAVALPSSWVKLYFRMWSPLMFSMSSLSLLQVKLMVPVLVPAGWLYCMSIREMLQSASLYMNSAV